MQATAKTIDAVREAADSEFGVTIWMTAREFAALPHNLDRNDSDTAYTKSGEKWGWAGHMQVWARIAKSGFKPHYRKNSKRATKSSVKQALACNVLAN